MTQEQLHAIQGTIAESIEKNVNGKIRALDFKIDTYIREDNEYKQRMKDETEKWRAEADEKLELMANIQGFSKISFKILAFIIAVGGAVAVILKGFHNK